MRTRSHMLAVAPMVLALALAGLGCNTIRAKAALQDGNRAYTEENYRDAIAEYEQAIALDSDLAPAYFYLGSSHQALYRPSAEGDPDNDAHLTTAIENYKKTLEVATGGSEVQKSLRMNALAALTGIYSEDPHVDYDTAIGYANQLIGERPEDIKNLFAMANLFEKFDRIDEAERTYVKAAEINPGDIKVCGALAAFYNRPLWDGQAKFENAIRGLERCASLAPDDPTGFYKVASFYWDKAFRDPMLEDAQKDAYADKGLAAVDRALGLKPDYIDALVYKGLLFRVKAQFTQDPRQRATYLNQAETFQEQAVRLREQQETEAPLDATE